MTRGQPSARAVAFGLACVALCAHACARPRERLVIGLVRQPATALVHVAAERGLFADERLDVDLREYSSGRDALAAAMEGRVDVATVYTTPLLVQAFTGSDARILTTLHYSSLNTGVVARSDRGIRTAGDLRGKTVGVPRGTNAEFFLRTLLEFAGVDWDEVRVVDVRVVEAAQALATGRLDALAIWSPIYDGAVAALGPGGAVTLHSDIYSEYSMLVTRPALVASRRAALVAALRALSRAQRAVSEEPERAVTALGSALPDLEPSSLRAQLARIRPRLGLSHALLQNLRSEAEWLARAGRLPRSTVDIRSLVASDLLDAVDPELVTLGAQP